MNQENEKLFSTFPPVSTSEWEAKVNEDLKGADYEKRLIWRTNEGFSVKPYYRSEDVSANTWNQSLPGEFPFVRGNSQAGNHWEIRQDIDTDDVEQANHLAKEALERGAEGLGLVASEITEASDFETLLSEIDLSKANLHFNSATSYPALAKLFNAFLQKNRKDVNLISGSFDFDPISYLLLHGDFYGSEQSDMAEIATMLNLCKEALPAMKAININAQYFVNAGSSLSQELAFGLAAGTEYLIKATEAGLKTDDVLQRLTFTFGITSDYFMEIAKLRAARLLWSKIVSRFEVNNQQNMAMYICSVTSAWNKTLYDAHVNLLRSTTEAMSAILGGTQSLSIVPFDTFYKDPDELSIRLARNQQVILREEAYLDKVSDPAAGSYYIDNLTNMLAEAAWKLFLDVEDKGGMVEAIKQGFIQDSIAANASKRKEDIANRRIVLLGTNQFPNLNEELLNKISFSEEEELEEEETYADDDTEYTEDDEMPSTYKKLELFGASDDFDELRLATEQYVTEGNKQPVVFLFNYGNLAMRKARASFVTNFFGCAGYKIIDNAGFANPEEGLAAVLEVKPEIVVLCSSDEEYATLAPEIAKRIKQANPSTTIVVAGNPKEVVETLKNAGVDYFIHVRSNVLESLEIFHEKLGIF
jgi:methylmalonyl-CoA mutase